MERFEERVFRQMVWQRQKPEMGVRFACSKNEKKPVRPERSE